MDLRKWRERFSQQKLGEANADRDRARKALKQSLDNIDEHNQLRRGHVKDNISAGNALSDAQYSQRLIREAQQKAKVVEQSERSVKKCRDELIEKSREKKVLEKLHGRRYDEYRSATERQLQTIQDDEAARRHHGSNIDEK